MFKKIAHNSTINSLPTGVSFGNKDLKPLQDLISLEKSIGLSFQKLSADITKASEALRTWGLGEGDDLGDTLTASTHLMLQFATALTNYSTHETTIREHMKSVRGREEALDDSKRRRKAVVAKAEGVEKKVSKMSPEHKNLGMQTDTLNQLRDQIRQMDTEIMAEEASISDFKRTSTKMWMALKFGGLQEVTEKGTIVAEYGKLIIANIPNDITQPGFARALYQGHGKTQSLVEEANLAINDIQMSQLPTGEPMGRGPRFSGTDNASPPRSGQMPGQGWPPPEGPPQSASVLTTPYDMGSGHFMNASESSPAGYPNAMNAMGGGGGPPAGYPNAVNAIGGSGGPPAGYPPFSNNGPPMSPYGEPPPSFNEVATAPAPQPFGALEPPERTGSVPPPTRSVDDFGVAPQQLPGSKGPAGGRFATFPVKGPGGPRGIALRDDPPSLASRPPEAEESFSSSIAAALGTSDSFPSSSQPASQDSFTPARPPPGAAAPAAPGTGDSPWGSPSRGNFDDHARDNTENTDEPGLAYMYGGHEEEEAPHEAQEVEYEKKVRFNSGVPSPFTPYPDTPKFIPSGQNSPALSPMAEHYPPAPSISHDPSPSRRVPPPRFDPEDDAKARNAAAAEEIKREMDALSSDAIDNIGSPPPSEPVTAPLDLSPPSAPFTRRQISPRPSLDMNLRGPYDSGQQSQPGSFHETPSHIAPPYESPTREKPSSPLASYKLPSSPAASFGTPLNPSNDELPSPGTKSHTQLPSISIDGNSAPSERSPATHSPSGSFSYSTPPEYPRNMYNRSTSSLNQTAPMGSATGKISAAAFRRPQNRMGSSDLRAPGEVSPLNMKKRLPSSPYPEHRSTLSREASPSPSLDPPAPISAPVPSSPLAKPLSPALAQEDDDFDYIGAYVNANQDDIPPQPAASPPTVDYADYGKLGKMRIANEQSSGGRYDDLR